MSVRVVVASSPRSRPFSSLRRWDARKSEHCLPPTSMTWMNSPPRTSYASAVAASTRKSSRRAGRGGVLPAVGAEHRHLRYLAAVLVDDGHSLVGAEREHGRAAGTHEVGLEERVLGEQPANEGRERHVTRRRPAPSPPSRPLPTSASRRARACRR